MATDKAIVIERAKRGSPRSLTRKRRGGPGAMLGAAILAALAGGVLVAGWAGAAPSDTRGTVRAVDITLLCSTVNVGGWREIKASGWPQQKTPSYATGARLFVQTGPGFGAVTLVSISSAHPDETGVGGVYHHRTRCAGTLARIPATPRGLPGPPETHGTGRDCQAPQRVVVRLRATLRSPGAWGVFGERRELRGIRRNVVTASVAVRTWPGRKPLSFATIDERGIARLWTSYDCT